MKIADTSTPVVVLHCGLGALSIMRTLGRLGVDVYGVSEAAGAPALRSRYCRSAFIFNDAHVLTPGYTDYLTQLRGRFSCDPVLIATSDETAIAIAENFDRLSSCYLIAQNSGAIVHRLADKMQMFGIAEAYSVPTPGTVLPATMAEAREYARTARYPLMLKGAMGNRLFERTGKKMVIVNSESELIGQFSLLEDPNSPNVMIQELIPGDDDQVYIFNGYFNEHSDCLAAYTGRKLRQFPIHTGCASLGECIWVQEVADLTTSFMKQIGYRGILDIGYRKDPRDGKFKVLDINPRVGQAFRLFVSENDLDVVRALYCDITGQQVPNKSPPREGRRWIIEDFDLISSIKYMQEGSLTFIAWIKSFSQKQERAWFSVRDPLPFIDMLGRLFRLAARSVLKRITGKKPGTE